MREKIGDNISLTAYGTGKAGSFPGPETDRVTIPLPSVAAHAIDQLASELFPGRYFPGRPSTVRVPIHAPVFETVYKFAVEKFGELWPAQDVDTLKNLMRRWDFCQDLLAEYTSVNVLRIWRKRMEAATIAASHGKVPEVPGEISERSVELFRKSVRMGPIAEISQLNYSLLRPKCERIRDAATIMAVKKYGEERDSAENLRLPFRASALLEALTFIAVSEWEAPIANLGIGSFYAMLAPVNVFFSTRLFDWQSTDKVIADMSERAKMEAEMRRLIAENRERILERQNADQASKAAAHLEAVESISRLNDQLRESAAAQSAAMRAARPVPVVRVLNEPQPPQAQ